MMLVVHRQRISAGVRPSLLTVNVSSSPSSSEAAASGYSVLSHAACVFSFASPSSQVACKRPSSLSPLRGNFLGQPIGHVAHLVGPATLRRLQPSTTLGTLPYYRHVSTAWLFCQEPIFPFVRIVTFPDPFILLCSATYFVAFVLVTRF
jgi:hypothetical protein